MARPRGKLPDGGGVWAWQALRARQDYLADWMAHAVPPEHEPAPFHVRVRSAADLLAARWGLWSWENPAAVDGPGSGFWLPAPVLRCALSEDEPPLLAMVREAKSKLTGLRLADGRLLLKVERGPKAVQLLLEDAGPFPEGGGIELRHGLPGLAETAARELDLWALVGQPAPPGGRWRGMNTNTTSF